MTTTTSHHGCNKYYQGPQPATMAATGPPRSTTSHNGCKNTTNAQNQAATKTTKVSLPATMAATRTTKVHDQQPWLQPGPPRFHPSHHGCNKDHQGPLTANMAATRATKVPTQLPGLQQGPPRPTFSHHDCNQDHQGPLSGIIAALDNQRHPPQYIYSNQIIIIYYASVSSKSCTYNISTLAILKNPGCKL